MTIEAILLTGGGSTRMDIDKAAIELDGVPIGLRTAAALKSVADQVTVLGRLPLEGFPFLADFEEQGGPLAALARFAPTADFAFVASCDMPHFHPGIVEVLHSELGDGADAAVTVRAGIRQPTCALYRRDAFAWIPEVMSAGKKSLMAWLDRIGVVTLDEIELRRAGLEPIHFASFNTPEELARIGAEWARFNEEREPSQAPEG